MFPFDIYADQKQRNNLVYSPKIIACADLYDFQENLFLFKEFPISRALRQFGSEGIILSGN